MAEQTNCVRYLQGHGYPCDQVESSSSDRLENRIVYISVFAGDALASIRGGSSQTPLSEAEARSGPRRIVVAPNWGRRVVRRG